MQNSAPTTRKAHEAGKGTRYKASPLLWHTRNTMVIPKIQLWTEILDLKIFFSFVFLFFFVIHLEAAPPASTLLLMSCY